MTSALEHGFTVRRLRPIGTDTAPGYTLEQVSGRGIVVVSGARAGYRLYARKLNGVEELLDLDLHDGMTWPMTFDQLRLVTNRTSGQIEGAGNEGDAVDLVLGIFTDQRVLVSAPTRQSWIERVDVARIAFQSIAAAGGTYTVWDDVPDNESSAAPGNAWPGTPWVDRFQSGPSTGSAETRSGPFVRPMVLKAYFGFATSTAGVTAPKWYVMAYVNRDDPGAGEYLYEGGNFSTMVAGGTSWFYVNGNRQSSIPGGHGLLWPAGGGRFVLENTDPATAIGVRGFFGFVGQS